MREVIEVGTKLEERIEAAFPTSSTAPRPLFPSHELTPSAPAAEVAVPITRAPAAAKDLAIA